jgi:elongation factor Ts
MAQIEQVKKLREETGISIAECQKALEESGGDIEKAKKILIDLGKELMAKRADKEAGQGIIDSYVHPNKKVGVLLDLRCESDFVARSGDFINLAHEICLQIAAMSPASKEELLLQPWIKDASKLVETLVNEQIAKLGEKIVVFRFERYGP